MSALLPTYARSDLVFERGEGAYLFTAEGERYLDFGSGVAVTALGHAHPHLVAALTEQAKKLWHISNLFRIAGGAARRAALRRTFADTVFFTNSGAEAMECAWQCRAPLTTSSTGQPDRYRVITAGPTVPRPHARDHCRRRPGKKTPRRVSALLSRLRIRSPFGNL